MANEDVKDEPDPPPAPKPRPRRGRPPSQETLEERRARLVEIATLQTQRDLEALQAEVVATLVEMIAERLAAEGAAGSDRRAEQRRESRVSHESQDGSSASGLPETGPGDAAAVTPVLAPRSTETP